eukprot:COSAG01_NODE_4875_length_4661_cov_2.548882_2_plen_161_part_00
MQTYQFGHIWKCGQSPPWKLLQCVCVHVNCTTAPLSPTREACTGGCSFFFPPLHEQLRLSTHCTSRHRRFSTAEHCSLAKFGSAMTRTHVPCLGSCRSGIALTNSRYYFSWGVETRKHALRQSSSQPADPPPARHVGRTVIPLDSGSLAEATGSRQILIN